MDSLEELYSVNQVNELSKTISSISSEVESLVPLSIVIGANPRTVSFDVGEYRYSASLRENEVVIGLSPSSLIFTKDEFINWLRCYINFLALNKTSKEENAFCNVFGAFNLSDIHPSNSYSLSPFYASNFELDIDKLKVIEDVDSILYFWPENESDPECNFFTLLMHDDKALELGAHGVYYQLNDHFLKMNISLLGKELFDLSGIFLQEKLDSIDQDLTSYSDASNIINFKNRKAYQQTKKLKLLIENKLINSFSDQSYHKVLGVRGESTSGNVEAWITMVGNDVNITINRDVLVGMLAVELVSGYAENETLIIQKEQIKPLFGDDDESRFSSFYYCPGKNSGTGFQVSRCLYDEKKQEVYIEIREEN